MSEKIGALWLKKSKGGLSYMSGVIEINNEKIRIAVFKNNEKTTDKYPDYNIIKSEQQQSQKKEDDVPF